MYHLRLVKGKSYWGAVKATAENPDVFVEDDGKYASAMKSGYFEDLTDTEQDVIDQLVGEGMEVVCEETVVGEEANPFSDLTLVQLREYAEKKGIDISHLKKKDEIVSAIQDAESRAAQVRAMLRE